jgi:hypothetical protein
MYNKAIPEGSHTVYTKKKNQKDKTRKRRKSCKGCKYFKYGYNEKTKKYGYYCEITNRFADTYNQKIQCDFYNKDIEDIHYEPQKEKKKDIKKEKVKYPLITYKEIADVTETEISTSIIKRFDGIKPVGNGKLYIKCINKDDRIIEIRTSKNGEPIIYKAVSERHN